MNPRKWAERQWGGKVPTRTPKPPVTTYALAVMYRIRVVRENGSGGWFTLFDYPVEKVAQVPSRNMALVELVKIKLMHDNTPIPDGPPARFTFSSGSQSPDMTTSTIEAARFVIRCNGKKIHEEPI